MKLFLLLLLFLLCGCVTESERNRCNQAQTKAWLDALEQQMKEAGVP